MSDETPVNEFDSLLDTLRAGENVPETIYDDLRSVHNLAIEGSRAAINERDAAIEEMKRSNLELKARNHDLLLQSPVYSGSNKADEESETDDTPPGHGGIDSLFETMRRGRN